jgi:hypothetical protein
MTSPPITGRGRHTVYTGRTTSWPMVAVTCVGALVVVVMSSSPSACSPTS